MWFISRNRRRQNGRNMARQSRFVPRLEILEDRMVPSTLTVLNNLDSGAGSLRDTITKAKDGDTIVFARSLDGQMIALTSNELAIKNSVDIEGPGADKLAVSGSDKYRVFDIVSEGLTVRIAGLTISHGRTFSGQGGGGILNMGSRLTLAGDVLSDNEVHNAGLAQGGAVANHNGAILSAIDTTFVGNQAVASTSGGFGLGFGGAIFNSSFDNKIGATATVDSCTFINNRAVGGDDGVVSGFFNTGSGEGGGIFNETGGTLTVADSTFTGNQAIGGNGGSGGKFAGVSLVDAGVGGGITSSDGTTLFVSGSTFSYNLALGGSNGSGSTRGPGTVGFGAGGALGQIGQGAVTNCDFDHNQALGGSGNSGASTTELGRGVGGAIQNSAFLGVQATLTARGCTFTDNHAVGGNGNTGSPFVNEGIGGAIDNTRGAVATVTGSAFNGNQAIGGQGGTGQDGGAGLGGALANVLGSTLTVTGCALSGNQAIGGAGGASANGGNGFGGGIYNDGQSTLTVTGSTITGNEAMGGAAGSGGSAGQGIGGGFYLASAGVVCLDIFTVTNILGNTASTSNNDVFGAFTLCL
jgi:hypothetical protein